MINRVCIILWIILFMVGIWLSMHKPLWCDELYSQKITIEGNSWGKILSGQMEEGINFPLYYLIQKSVTSVLPLQISDDIRQDFKLPWQERKYGLFAYPKGQIILRILPNIFTTTAIVFLVRFFWINGGFMVALVALLSALSSGNMWRYWVEARPYSLWFLLTILQGIFLFKILKKNKGHDWDRDHRTLMIGHWFLAATMIQGCIQVMMVQAILYMAGQRDLKKHVWMGILPVGIALSWMMGRPSVQYYFMDHPLSILTNNFSIEMVGFVLIYVMAYVFHQAWINRKGTPFDVTRCAGGVFLPYLFAGLSFAAGLMVYILYRWPNLHDGFPIYSRHFYYLSAIGIMMIPMMFSDVWEGSKEKPFWRAVFGSFFLLLLLSRCSGGLLYAWYAGNYY